jgi:hypothetical protein
VSSKKVLIMPSPAESSSEGVPREPTAASFPRGSEGDLQLQIGYLLADIRESLGELRNAAKVSDDARKVNDERILQLVERITRAETTLSGLEKTTERHNSDLRATIDRHATDINGLGRVAHTADRLVRIGYGILVIVGGPILLYIYHHVTLVFSK